MNGKLMTIAKLSLISLGFAWFASTSGAFDYTFGDPRPTRPPGEYKAPEFTHRAADEWINSEPLTLSDLRGSVVLIDFWTFDCWNCYRSFPWLNGVEATYGNRGLQIIGVHTPEFDHERIRENIIDKVEEFKLHHPVMIDNDFSYWKAMHNRYWPAFYLIDKRGTVRAAFVGETHADTAQATKIERIIEALLAEE